MNPKHNLNFLRRMYIKITLFSFSVSLVFFILLFTFVNPMPTEPYEMSGNIQVFIFEQGIFFLFLLSVFRLVKKENSEFVNIIIIPSVPVLFFIFLNCFDYNLRGEFIRSTIWSITSALVFFILVIYSYIKIQNK